MCLGENDKYGPRRCSGHAREELATATSRMDNARVEVATIGAEQSAVREAWIASSDAELRLKDKTASAGLTPEQSLALLDEAEQERKVAVSAHDAYLRLSRDRLVAQAAFNDAVDGVNTKRDQYDATPEGLTALSAKLNQAEVDYGRAETQDQRIDAGTRVTMLTARREFAERRAKREAINRIKNYEDLDGTYERINAQERWEMNLDDARDAERIAATADEKLAASAGLRNAEAHLRDIHREQRGISRMNPWRASNLGDASREEVDAWGTVSSVHKPIAGPNGEHLHEIMVRREANGSVTQARIEVPADTYELPRNFADHGRHPSTTIVMRDLTSRARAYDRAGGSKKAFVANGGAADDFPRAKSASTAIDRLFARVSAPAEAT